MPYALKSTDSFNRADGTLPGSTLDNASGGSETNTWTTVAGTAFTIASNRGVNAGSPAFHLVEVGSTADAGDMRVSGISYLVGAGLTARVDVSSRSYLFYRGTTTSILFVDVAGTGAYTQIGDTTTLVADGDEMAIVGNGGGLSCEINGTLVIGPITNGSIASGKPGMYSDGGGAGFDAFKYQTGTAGGATPTKLGITTQPAGNQSGVNFPTQPVVAVQDVSSATVTTDTSTVVATLNTLSGSGTLSGTTSVAAVAGVATFTNLKITGTGSFTITFTDGSLDLATTTTIYVGATKVHVTSQPATAFTQRIHGNVVVAVQDGGSATVGNATNSVTIALTVVSGVAVLTSGTTTRSAVSGVATFNDLLVTCSDGATWTYAVSASGLTGDTTSPVTGTVRSLDIPVTIA